MEKAMTVSGKMIGTENSGKAVKEMARNRDKGHMAIWLEVLKDVRSQWEEAENGTHRRYTR